MAELLDETTVSTSIEVDVSQARAFHLFTAEIGAWWDADKHILRAPLAEMEFQPFVGGHIIDRGTDGSERRWARVLAYDPPSRVVFSWDINVRWEIESDPERASEVEVTFTALTQQRTAVRLTHRHLDRHGPGWEDMRDAVAGGWSLEGFALFAGAQGADRATLRLASISDEAIRAWLSQAKPYTVALLHRTESYAQSEVEPIVWEHGRRNMALLEAGELLVLLAVADDSDLAGLGVFAGDRDRGAAILDEDPGVQAGIFRYQLHCVRGFPGAALR